MPGHKLRACPQRPFPTRPAMPDARTAPMPMQHAEAGRTIHGDDARARRRGARHSSVAYATAAIRNGARK